MSSGIRHCVVQQVVPDVSKDCGTSIFKGQTLKNNAWPLKKKGPWSFKNQKPNARQYKVKNQTSGILIHAASKAPPYFAQIEAAIANDSRLFEILKSYEVVREEYASFLAFFEKGEWVIPNYDKLTVPPKLSIDEALPDSKVAQHPQ